MQIENFYAVRLVLYELQDGRCCYCGIVMQLPPVGWTREARKFWHARTRNFATVEHLRRVADGGTNDIGNLALACYPCNFIRGALMNHRGLALQTFLRRARLGIRGER